MRKVGIIAVLGAVAYGTVPILAGVANQAGQPPANRRAPTGQRNQTLLLAQPKMAQPPYVHTVVFYLKKDTPPAKVEAVIADCHSILAKIPSVRALWAGRPAAKGTPDVAVKDYQVALTIAFDNYDGLKAYLEHPTHLGFVKTYTPIFEKAVIYDFENQAK